MRVMSVKTNDSTMFRNVPKIGSKLAKKRIPCAFCKTCTKNKYQLGRLLTSDDITAHYYCILFAPALKQNGRVKEGIKGFLVDDIKKEMRRGSRLRCNYCNEKGATIGCAVEECRIKFHLPCGIINKSFHDFHNSSGTFPSFCSQHRPNQIAVRRTMKQDDQLCLICCDNVIAKPMPSTLISPCCGHWYHRECLQKQAYHAGEHHFKCPNCSNKNEFVREMKTYGVHVPERDASWERRREFEYLNERNYRCDVRKCVCSKGREHNGDKRWEIIVCDGCGANGTHIKCSHLAINEENWFCDVCKPIVNKKTPLSTAN